MSHGVYLEFANRAFERVDVHVDYVHQSDWEHKKWPPLSNWVLTKDNYLSSNRLEMANVNVHGIFKVTITINGKSENFGSKEFDLNDGNSGTRNWSYCYSRVIDDCVILVTYGKALDKLVDDHITKKAGFYRFEIFRASKRRIAVMTDYHYGCKENGNTGNQINVVNEINRLRDRPEFLVMTGDLLHNPTKLEDRDIWKNFIDPLELKNIPVADGFGNHDLWTGFGAENVKKDIKKRNKTRKSDWKLFGYSDSENKKTCDNDGYHYRWRIDLQKRMANGEMKQKHIECIMLNNVPGETNVDDIGKKGDKKVDDSQKEGTWSFDSLGFLERSLSKLDCPSARKDTILLLFFHINYESESMENTNAFYRWWPREARGKYNDILKKCKFPNCAFFGHIHDEEMFHEELHMDSCETTGLKGYRCAVSKTNRYLNVIDLELVEENGECKLRMTTKYGKTADLTVKGDSLKDFDTKYF